MSNTMTEKLQHRWVKHTITEVSTVIDPDNEAEIFIFEDKDDKDKAEANAVYGCDVCGAPMEGNTETDCNPVCHCGTDWEHHQTETHNFVEMR